MIKLPHRLYRISIFASLEGLGGMHADGRWSRKGHQVVYLADSEASAVLEILAHLDLGRAELPDDYQVLEVALSRGVSIEDLVPPAVADWRQQQEATRDIGDEWLQSKRTVLARVPSALAGHSFNYLLNPKHPQAGLVKIEKTSVHPLDSRLLRKC